MVEVGSLALQGWTTGSGWLRNEPINGKNAFFAGEDLDRHLTRIRSNFPCIQSKYR